MNDIKLIASDLDDTLLGPDLRLSERTVRAMRAAGERGIPTVLATNRSYQATLPYLRELGITGPVITYGGAQIRDAATGALLRGLSIPAPLVRRALAFAAAQGVYLQVHRDSAIYYEKSCDWSRWYENYIGYPGTQDPELSKTEEPATKLLILCEATRIRELLVAARAEFGEELWVTSSKPTFLELNHPEASKRAALEYVAAHYGVPREAIAAFGDQPEVDGGMLRFAGMGVAMGNAPEELKRAAPYVTAANAEDGVAQFLEERLLGWA